MLADDDVWTREVPFETSVIVVVRLLAHVRFVAFTFVAGTIEGVWPFWFVTMRTTVVPAGGVMATPVTDEQYVLIFVVIDVKGAELGRLTVNTLPSVGFMKMSQDTPDA